MARKLKGRPMWPEVPMWPGLSAGFCLLLLSTMLDVLEARLSRVLPPQDKDSTGVIKERAGCNLLTILVPKQACYSKELVTE